MSYSLSNRFSRPVVLISLVVLLACAVPLCAARRGSKAKPRRAAGAHSPSSQTPSRSFDFHYLVDVSALRAKSGRLKIWVPLPYEVSPYQQVSGLHIKAPVRYDIRSEHEYDNRYAYFDLDASKIKASFQIELTFHVKRFEHRVGLQPVAEAPARTQLVDRFLRPDRLVPIDGEIGQLSRQQTQGISRPMEKAHKIYDYVIATMHYDHAGTGWGRGDAVWACNSKHGNCTDFHSLFIGMARAAGIPARFEIGFPLPLNAHEGTIAGYHCWAEFWINGIGWIPIDASEAWQDPSKKNYFFGATDDNRVMFSLGRDIRLNPPPAGEPLNFFVYPYAELDGKPYTDLKHEFSFRDDAAGAVTTAQNR